jgi:hypothetical protein
MHGRRIAQCGDDICAKVTVGRCAVRDELQLKLQIVWCVCRYGKCLCRRTIEADLSMANDAAAVDVDKLANRPASVSIFVGRHLCRYFDQSVR